MVMTTQRPATAYTFDAGLSVASSSALPWRSIAFTDTSDAMIRKEGDASRKPAVSPKVRARMIVAEGAAGGSLGIVPQIGRARLNPVTNAHLVCRLLLEKTKYTKSQKQVKTQTIT